MLASQYTTAMMLASQCTTAVMLASQYTTAMMLVGTALLFAILNVGFAYDDRLFTAVRLLECEDKCLDIGRCESLLYLATTLRCESATVSDAKNSNRRRKTTNKYPDASCPRARKNIFINNKHGALTCMKVGRDDYKWKEGASKTGDVTERKPDDILYENKNISLKAGEVKLKLPFPLQPGMKLVVIGSRSNKDNTLMKFSSPKPMIDASFLMMIEWSSRSFSFDIELALYRFRREFPISDSSNFVLTMELKRVNMKIYADGTRLMSFPTTSGLQNLTLIAFGKVIKVAVQKIEGNN